MKTVQLSLPNMQFAAALFFAGTSGTHALPVEQLAARTTRTYCTDGTNTIVDDTNCDGSRPAGQFFLFNAPTGGQLGDTVENPDRVDAADRAARERAGFVAAGVVNGFRAAPGPGFDGCEVSGVCRIRPGGSSS